MAFFVGGLALLLWLREVNDGRIAALTAGALLVVCVGACLRVLRLDPLSAPMVYLYVFGLFHLGLAVPWALGLQSSPTPSWMLNSRLAPALTLVVAALWAYLLGAAFAALRRGPRKTTAKRPVRYSNVVLYHCGLGIFVAGLLAFGLGIGSLGWSAFLQANYTETYRLANWNDPRLFVSSLSVAPIGLYLAAAGARWRHLAVVISLLSFWSVLVFFLGFRGFALIPFVTTLAVLRKRGLHLPKWVYLAGLAALLLAIPLGRSLRQKELGGRSFSRAVVKLEPLAALEEMGGSLRPLVHTVDFMQTESFRWGKTYWRALQRIRPNLSPSWQGPSYIPLEELPPTHWVTRQAAPWTYRNFGGLGFSAVAEPYMNFGVGGVMAYFFALAALLVWADRAVALRPTRLAVWASILGPLLWTTRGSFESFFRPVAWGLACVLAARLLADSLYAIRRANRGKQEAAQRGAQGDPQPFFTRTDSPQSARRAAPLPTDRSAVVLMTAASERTTNKTKGEEA